MCDEMYGLVARAQILGQAMMKRSLCTHSFKTRIDSVMSDLFNKVLLPASAYNIETRTLANNAIMLTINTVCDKGSLAKRSSFA
jgi:hypothetical protein